MHPETVRRILTQQGLPADTFKRRPSAVDPYLPFVRQTLETYPNLRSSRIWAMIRDRGYPGSQDHFRTILARLRPPKPAEAFLRLATLPGEQAQVDWAHFGTLDCDGHRRSLLAFVMVLSWSRRIFLRFFRDGTTASFLQGHLEAFEAFQGVPRVILCDNLKSAVLERRGAAVRFNDLLLEFASAYRFEPRPVAVRRGNEKGRVERAIRYIRESFFAARAFRDLDDLNAQARAWCLSDADNRTPREHGGRSVRDLFAEEQGRLLPLPEDRPTVCDRVVAVVGKTPYVRFDRNDYSVPADRVRRALVVEATEQRVRIFEDTTIVAEHPRCWGAHQTLEAPAHIQALVDFKREASQHRHTDRLRAAAPHSEAFLVQSGLQGGPLGAVVKQLHDLLDRFGGPALDAALGQALAAGTFHIGALRHLLDRRKDAGPPPVRISLGDKAARVVVRPHTLAAYDQAHLTETSTSSSPSHPVAAQTPAVMFTHDALMPLEEDDDDIF
jgi:transposase